MRIKQIEKMSFHKLILIGNVGLFLFITSLFLNCSSKTEQNESRQSSSGFDSTDIKRDQFKKWALENTAVIDIAINSNSLFVTLKPEKYTSEENVQQIANFLSKAYVMQTGQRSGVCRIFLGGKEYAKGDFYRD